MKCSLNFVYLNSIFSAFMGCNFGKGCVRADIWNANLECKNPKRYVSTFPWRTRLYDRQGSLGLLSIVVYWSFATSAS